MKTSLGKAWEVANAAALINACFLLGIIIFVLIVSSPLAHSVSKRIWEMNYPDPLAGVSNEAKLARVKEAIEIATADGTFWKSYKTIEEKYKGVYSENYPPPYWLSIQEDFTLGKKLGLVKLEKLPAYGNLSRKERLLLCHPDDANWPIALVDQIVHTSGLAPYDKLDRPDLNGWPSPWNVDFSLRFLLWKENSKKGGKLSSSEVRDWLWIEMSRLHVNPFTNSFIKLDCREFSVGNAYVEFHFEDEEWIKLMNGYLAAVTDYSPQQAREMELVYYRIYGEYGVIAEGVRADKHARFKAGAPKALMPVD